MTAAETKIGGRRLTLTCWQAGKKDEITLQLPVLGTFSATAPYDCPKSQRILAQGLDELAARMTEADDTNQQDP